MGPRRPPRLPGREARRWDDPGSDDDDDDGEEEFHPQTDRGLEGEDDSEEDLKGSDSEGERGADEGLASLGGLEAFTRKRAAKEQPQDEGLWDPLFGLAPRKKLKGAAAGPGRVTGPKEGSAVILHSLSKAPNLNGKTGTVAAVLDGATGRCQVILADNSVKSLKVENLRQVLTGSVVQLKGLQAAPQLNGLTAECGDLDLATERYTVTLADSEATVKKVKEANLELVGRYLQPKKFLWAQKKPFVWKAVLQEGKNREHQPWSSRIGLLTQHGLPPPLFVDGTRLADSKNLTSPVTTVADKLPITDEGRLACRLLAVSTERDAWCPSKKEELRRLGTLAEALRKRDGDTPTFFLVPGLCTEALGCLRASASLAWPFYLQLCQAVVCVQTEHLAHKAWCRMEQLLASQALSQPLYLLSPKGSLTLKKPSTDGEGSWLLSDTAEEMHVGAPGDGQVLPAERPLLEQMCDALPGGWRKGASITCYRL